MSRHRASHAVAVAELASRLRASGHTVSLLPQGPGNGGVDLEVDGHAVAVRVSSGGKQRHCVSVDGKRYSYRHRKWIWNLHVHGAPSALAADVLILAALAPGGASTWFVLPRKAIGGPTVQTWRCKRARRWGGMLRQWVDAWHLLAPIKQAAEEAA